jgi:glycosidase
MPGVPMLYYGTEQGFNGANDPSNREDLFRTGFNQNHPTYQWISQLTAIRQQYPALRRGDMEFKWTSDHTDPGEDTGILAFVRRLDQNQVLVVLNTSDAGESYTSLASNPMNTGFPANTKLHDLIGGGDYQTDDQGQLTLSLKARQNMLLVPVP